MILLPVFGHTATEHGFEIRQVGDVYDSIDTVDKGRERIIGSVAMAEQDDKVFAALRGRFTYQLLKNRIGVERCAFEVFVHNNHVVGVGLELEQHVLFKKSEVHVVLKVDQLWRNELLVLLMVNADERGVVADPQMRIELGSWSIT